MSLGNLETCHLPEDSLAVVLVKDGWGCANGKGHSSLSSAGYSLSHYYIFTQCLKFPMVFEPRMEQ